MYNNKTIVYDKPSPNFMGAFFENSPICMAIVGYDLSIICVNKTFARLFKYSKTILSQMNLRDLLADMEDITTRHFIKQIETPEEESGGLRLIYKKQCGKELSAITHARNIPPDNNYEEGRFILTFELCKTSTKEKEYQMTREAVSAINREMALSANERFLDKLVKGISETLDIPYVLVGKYYKEENSITTQSFWMKDKFVEDFKYNLDFTPCESVIKNAAKKVFPKGVQNVFPKDKDLVDLGVEGYIGLPLINAEREVVGHIVAMDTRPLEYTDLMESLLQLYSTRVIAELDRLANQNALREKESHYRALFENGFDGIMIYDIFEGKMKTWNNKFLEYLGITEEQARMHHPTDYIPEYQPDGQKTADVLEYYLTQVLKVGRASYDLSHKKENGDFVHAETTVIRLPAPSDHLAVYIFRDITEKKNAEEALKEKNLELQKYIDSNLQLENFAYVASHDMKEPLRNIGNFTQLLYRRYYDVIDDDGKEFIDYIITGVKGMNLLIEDLLSYSRVNSKEFEMGVVFTDKILFWVENHLGKILNERNAVLRSENIPETINANKIMCIQVFQNLITNAIKFTPPDVNPKITIKSRDVGDFWEFSVQDNGIGIAPEYHERIFILFKKLHNKTEYEGTGIGLAICKKIIEKHGGRIWVESETGKGATFYFTIPK